MTEEKDRDFEAYLAQIRTTIEKSNRLVEQVDLRIRETDRMLERQGLTRQQVMAMRFSDAQIEAANAELKRRGLDPIEMWDDIDGAALGAAGGGTLSPAAAESERGGSYRVESAMDDEVAYRQKKFGMMMKPFQL